VQQGDVLSRRYVVQNFFAGICGMGFAEDAEIKSNPPKSSFNYDLENILE
jgi:hypothetical protein